MKVIKILAIAVMLFQVNVSLAQSKAEKQVAAVVEKLRLAMISGNKADLESVSSEKLQYGHSGGKIESRQQFVETFTSGRTDFVTCDFSEMKITTSGKVAIVTFKLDSKTNDNNVPGEIHMRLMTTWQKLHGAWVMVARQAVKV